MQTLYPSAQYRPLGSQTQSYIGKPRILIAHTMVGTLPGTDSFFRQGGYTGTEAHFGVGGPWEGSQYDGQVYQWQVLDYSADAQYAGNAYATSVETSDGGNPGNPWSAKQLQALIALGVWWCQQTGAPARLVASPSQSGFGYHEQFPEWNQSGHRCPGPVREAQWRDVVIPAVAAALRPTSKPNLPVAAFYAWGAK